MRIALLIGCKTVFFGQYTAFLSACFAVDVLQRPSRFPHLLFLEGFLFFIAVLHQTMWRTSPI